MAICRQKVQHLCIDCRKLTAVTVANKTSPPWIQHAVGQAAFLLVVDLRLGFWQYQPREFNIPKTVLATPISLHEWFLMPSIMMNPPVTFVRLINLAIFDPLRKSVGIFFDDIIVYSATAKEHEGHLREVSINVFVHISSTPKVLNALLGPSRQNIRATLLVADADDPRTTRLELSVSGRYLIALQPYDLSLGLRATYERTSRHFRQWTALRATLTKSAVTFK